jgi:hypothetical protein
MAKIALWEKILPKQQAKVLRVTLLLATMIFNLTGQTPRHQQTQIEGGKEIE